MGLQGCKSVIDEVCDGGYPAIAGAGMRMVVRRAAMASIILDDCTVQCFEYPDANDCGIGVRMESSYKLQRSTLYTIYEIKGAFRRTCP